MVPFELFDSLNILDILSWDELLYISTLIDGEKSMRETLPFSRKGVYGEKVSKQI